MDDLLEFLLMLESYRLEEYLSSTEDEDEADDVNPEENLDEEDSESQGS